MRAFTVATCLLLAVSACQNSGQDSQQAPSAQTSFWGQPEPGATPKVLLVGWDGVRPDILREVSTPHFDSLVAAGTFSDVARTARPTVSGPDWSSILIGVWPEKHGVQSNDFSSNRYSEYPDI
ncbi:MAG: alkaline phosphatase family protein, partial [Longimicrobiales bacterium]|nr:alkaline phosphatase family protein [Longimicrobiales bacterium]